MRATQVLIQHTGWYYYGDRTSDGQGLPKNATGTAFMRASTLSLGSIAFGSLIVTILEMLQTLFQAIQNAEAQQGDSESYWSDRSVTQRPTLTWTVVGQILACCVRVANVVGANSVTDPYRPCAAFRASVASFSGLTNVSFVPCGPVPS